MASNPVIVACPADTWVNVATGVLTGVVHALSTEPHRYVHTYRVTTDPAPADDTEAVPFSEQHVISADTAIDVYIKAIGGDGSVRVDL